MYVTRAGQNCDPIDAVWWYDIYTVGHASAADMWICDTASDQPRDEQHPIPIWSSDRYGWETNLYTELYTVESLSEVVSGSTTGFACTPENMAGLTYLIYVYDDEGEYADCVTWGDDPAVFTSVCVNAI